MLTVCLTGPHGSLRAQEPPQECFKSTSQDGNIISPLIVKRVNPQYPGRAESQLLDGLVTFDAVIAADGSVQGLKVTHGLPQLIPNAAHAVQQWRYEPARVNGVAVSCKTTLSINFQLITDRNALAAANAAANFAPRIVPLSGVVGVKPTLQPPPTGVLRVSSRVLEAQMERRVEPVYPADASALDARGELFVLLTISNNGDVTDAQVLTGPFRFRDSAIAAVKQWRFKPYEIDGEPRDVQTMVSLDFAPTK